MEDLVQRLHEHGNVVDLETVTLVLYDPHQLHVELPDRRYWVHWLAWLDRQEASESQVRYVKHQVRFVTKVDVALIPKTQRPLRPKTLRPLRTKARHGLEAYTYRRAPDN